MVCCLTRTPSNFVFPTLSEIDDETLVEDMHMEQPHGENDAQEGRQMMPLRNTNHVGFTDQHVSTYKFIHYKNIPVLHCLLFHRRIRRCHVHER